MFTLFTGRHVGGLKRSSNTCDHTLLPVFRRGATSFPGSLILPPHRASGKMRDPGNEVGRWEGGHDTFTCRIICSKTRFWFFFSDWSRNNTCGLWFAVFWLAVIFQQDFRQKLVRKPNGSDGASFCQDEFSFVFVEDRTNSSLKAEGCSDVLAVKFSQQVSWKPQRCWIVSELFTKRTRRYISSLDSSVALDLVLGIILSLL